MTDKISGLNLYESNYLSIIELIPDLLTLQPSDHRKFVTCGFMDLHLDVLACDFDSRSGQNRIVIALAHNFLVNKDLVPDPDMEIALYPDNRSAEALTYQDSFRYDEVYPEPLKCNVELKESLNRFLYDWLKNIKSQGHAVVEKSSK